MTSSALLMVILGSTRRYTPVQMRQEPELLTIRYVRHSFVANFPKNSPVYCNVVLSKPALRNEINCHTWTARCLKNNFLFQYMEQRSPIARKYRLTWGVIDLARSNSISPCFCGLIGGSSYLANQIWEWILILLNWLWPSCWERDRLSEIKICFPWFCEPIGG